MRQPSFLLPALGLIASLACGGEGPKFQVHGQAWSDFGRLMHVSDSLIDGSTPDNIVSQSGNGVQSLGAQFTVVADLASNWEGAFGFGVHQINHALGSVRTSDFAISLYQNFLTESRLTYYMGDRQAPDFSATVGSFPFKYNSDVKNLGLYLLRGPVYPGLLMGGFGDFDTDTSKSTMLGAHLHHALGNFSHDLILTSERDIPPTFDWSLAYVANYKAWQAVEIGAGVNFYRLIPYNSKLETPGHLAENELNFKRGNYVEVDSATGDTTFFTHQGVKLTAFFSADLKRVFGIGSPNPEDMRLYGEAALLGVRNYGKTYDKRAQRIPVMLGFNFPTFGAIDLFSVEVEWYGSPYRNDLARIGNNNVVADWTTQIHPVPSPKPVDYSDYGIDAQGNFTDAQGKVVNVKGTALDVENMVTDNWKWSLFVEKSIKNHIRFTGQVANDHYRPRPVAIGQIFSGGGTKEAFSSGKDWYLMLRMGYYF